MLYGFVKGLLKIYFGVFYRVKVEGVENVPKSGSAILCSNHINLRDPLIIALYLKRLPRFIAKKELYKNFFLASLLRGLKAFPVDRGKMDMVAIKNCLKTLKEGELLGIFAQGKRVKEGDEASAKGGVALFAIKGQSPVIPIAIKSTYKPFSKIHITFGAPMEFSEYYGKKLSNEDLEKIANEIMNNINGMLR